MSLFIEQLIGTVLLFAMIAGMISVIAISASVFVSIPGLISYFCFKERKETFFEVEKQEKTYSELVAEQLTTDLKNWGIDYNQAPEKNPFYYEMGKNFYFAYK